MRPLDQRLYAWLAESDERRFIRAFDAYFSAAFPAVVRHLVRLSRWDAAHCEDLAQDALLRFFDRVGTQRRRACDTIDRELTSLRPLPLGELHIRQVDAWVGKVASVHRTAVGFRPAPEVDSADLAWKTLIRELTEQIPPLQRMGKHFLQSAQTAVAREPAAGAVDTDQEESAIDAGLTTFVTQLIDESTGGSTHIGTTERRLPGITPFCCSTWTVVRELPQLRIPTNSYLFEIALSIYLDECKKRGRKKRGGEGFDPHHASAPPGDMDTNLFEGVDEEECYVDAPALPAYEVKAMSHEPAVQDGTLAIEHEEFLFKFHQFLRRPVEQALEAVEAAATPGRKAAEQRKWESLARKLARTEAVLSSLGEGYTQEQTAERLDISRNQVKYIVEQMQEVYARFAGASPTSGAHHARTG